MNAQKENNRQKSVRPGPWSGYLPPGGRGTYPSSASPRSGGPYPVRCGPGSRLGHDWGRCGSQRTSQSCPPSGPTWRSHPVICLSYRKRSSVVRVVTWSESRSALAATLPESALPERRSSVYRSSRANKRDAAVIPARCTIKSCNCGRSTCSPARLRMMWCGRCGCRSSLTSRCHHRPR